MIEFFKERTLEDGQKISVHLNLHKKNFAITALQGKYKGRVVAYSNDFVIENATFKIQKKIQKRVRSKQVKEVHAWVIGTYTEGISNIEGKEAYYNPYLVDTFVDKKTGVELTKVKKMHFKERKMYYI